MGGPNPITAELERRFGPYLSPEKEAEWLAVKAHVATGQSVSGEVVARRPFGVFLDIGVGFPALLEVLQFGRVKEKGRYTSMAEYPAIGDALTARFVAFDDRDRQLHLTQRDSHPYLDSRA